MLIGCGGSGKSTLSKQLHEITGLPLIHLDQAYFTANWTPTPSDIWHQKVRDMSQQPRWIIDGNYGGTMDIRLEAADTIIFMDRPTRVSLSRVFWRSLKHHGQTRLDMAAGCKEHFSWEFLLYVARYNKTRRPGILEKLTYWRQHKQVFILRTDREVKAFLAEVKSSL